MKSWQRQFELESWLGDDGRYTVGNRLAVIVVDRVDRETTRADAVRDCVLRG